MVLGKLGWSTLLSTVNIVASTPSSLSDLASKYPTSASFAHCLDISHFSSGERRITVVWLTGGGSSCSWCATGCGQQLTMRAASAAATTKLPNNMLFESIMQSFLLFGCSAILPNPYSPYGYGWDNLHCTTTCLLYTSDAADERSSVDLGGRRII